MRSTAVHATAGGGVQLVGRLRIEALAALLALALLSIAAVALPVSGPSNRTDASGLPPAAGDSSTAAPLGPPPAPAAARRGSARSYGKLPLSFVPNKGQSEEGVRFYAQGSGHSFYFTPRKAILSFTKGDQGVALHLAPLGASRNARLEAGDRLPGKVNYLVGQEQHTNLPTYGQLAYREMWPGVDLVFRGQGGVLKYEFHVKPGADPSKIGLAYQGADSLALAASGALLIRTPLGTLRDSRPRSYQRVAGKRTAVTSRYALGQGARRYGFELGAYDRSRPLVIDPGIVYSTFLGGGSADVSRDIAIDSGGAAYVVGATSSTATFPTTVGAYDTSYNGAGSDVFVTKLNASGSALDYSTYLGGTSGEGARGIAVDSSGAAYVSGRTLSPDFPTTTGAYQEIYNGGTNDGYVTKLNPSGSALDYSTFLGGNANDLGWDVAVDSLGAAYVTGETSSANFPTMGAYDASKAGTSDAFVTKLSASGSALDYSTYLGGLGFSGEVGRTIEVDSSGAAYVAGSTSSSDFPTVGAIDATHNGGDDLFVTKMSTSGAALTYSTYLGGLANEGGTTSGDGLDLAVDAQGAAYVIGHTLSGGYPTTAGAFDTSFNGGSDLVVSKLNASGSALAYSTYLGGSGGEGESSGDDALGIAVDSLGAAYVTGDTQSTNFPLTSPGTYNGGSRDAFVTKLTASGSSLNYSAYLGGPVVDHGAGIAVDANRDVYITGDTDSSSFPTTVGSFDTSANGGFETFVTKMSLPDNHESASVPPGSTLETNVTVTPEDPIGTAVTNPSAGGVTRDVKISEEKTTKIPPSGKSYLSWQVDLDVSPSATAADPITIETKVDSSLLPAGTDETGVEIYKDGTQAPDCTGAPGTASPDPCVSEKTALGGGDIKITVKSSSASVWNFGVDAGQIIVVKDAVPNDAQNFSFTTGGGLTPTSFQLDDDSDPGLSNTRTFADLAPGSGYSVTEANPGPNWYLASATCDDGSSISNIDVAPGETVTCTFINSVNYPRPGGGTPLRVPLVPEYEPCTTPNATHVGPIDEPSCSPPSMESGQLTTGTVGNQLAFAKLEVFCNGGASGEQPPCNTTVGDQLDVRLTTQTSDVRKRSDGTDYTGKVILQADLRQTDRANVPGGVAAATAQDSPFSIPIDCVATTSTSVGSNCNLTTTLDSLLVANFAKEQKRAVISAFSLALLDAGGDGSIAPPSGTCPYTCGSEDEEVFLRQGLFAP